MISKKKIRDTWKEFSASPGGKRVKKFTRRLVIAFIVGIIIYQIADIGWREVLSSLPGEPLFYLIFFILYFSLPFTEIFIYRQIWPVKRWKLFRLFMTKRVYNEEVVGYSGEFFLFMQARKFLDDGDRQILKNIRDNNILSAINSNLVAFTLVGVLIFTGFIDIEELVGDIDWIYIAAAVFILALIVAVIVQFRKYIFDLPLKKALVIFGIYMTRFLIHHGLIVVQWAVVIPDTPISVWLLFLTVVIVVNRIPLLPSRDLVFMWVGIELSKMLNMATASVAGMLLVSSALRKVMNLILFLYLSTVSKSESLAELKEQELNDSVETEQKEQR
ncbi:hypothetical protein [Rhodohalobacter mucosus]|uniref:Lysylphosphatidylglycerol synthase TM region n=1 Tax=Rhodohalobacter mucosus TaxID=2079485 RepID=A0A316TRM5_9BACT|nr:hypothetical protein [Rhodohalobacter mucosus]PWN07217.1 hypothetical protein DDZ15_05305 [Rhodohalobacter mucosus]